MELIWIEITYLISKSIDLLLFHIIKRISNQILWIILAPGTAKLPKVKVWGTKKLMLDVFKMNLLSKLIFEGPWQVNFFITIKSFELWKFFSPLRHKKSKYFIWNSLTILNTRTLGQEHCSTLKVQNTQI